MKMFEHERNSHPGIGLRGKVGALVLAGLGRGFDARRADRNPGATSHRGYSN